MGLGLLFYFIGGMALLGGFAFSYDGNNSTAIIYILIGIVLIIIGRSSDKKAKEYEDYIEKEKELAPIREKEKELEENKNILKDFNLKDEEKIKLDYLNNKYLPKRLVSKKYRKSIFYRNASEKDMKRFWTGKFFWSCDDKKIAPTNMVILSVNERTKIFTNFVKEHYNAEIKDKYGQLDIYRSSCYLNFMVGAAYALSYDTFEDEKKKKVPWSEGNLVTYLKIFLSESKQYIKLKYPLYPIEVLQIRLANPDNFIHNDDFVDIDMGDVSIHQCVDSGTQNMGYYLGELDYCPPFTELIK